MSEDFVATHEHYKGSLYRVLATRNFPHPVKTGDHIQMGDGYTAMVTDDAAANVTLAYYEHQGGMRFLRAARSFDDEVRHPKTGVKTRRFKWLLRGVEAKTTEQA